MMRRKLRPAVAILSLGLWGWLAPSQAGTAEAQITFRAAASAGVPASTTITFRAAASAGAASGVLTLTINKPTGTVQNDVMIASIAVHPNPTITAPAGWTLVRLMANTAATANSLAVYRKVAGASEPANYSWTFSSSTGSAGGIQTFTGVDTTTPIDVENGQSTPSSLSHSTPSVTTTVANTMLVTSHGISNADTWTPPTGMTEAFDRLGGAEAIEGSYVLQAAAGPTGAKTATSTPGPADVGNAHILVLRPVGVSLTINKPTGTVQNDVMIASIAVRPNTVTITAPSGWTLVRRMDNANPTANSLAVYWKVAGASEPASYTWIPSAHTGAAGGIQAFSGVDTASPIDVENGNCTLQGSCVTVTSSHATPSVTTTVTNTMLVTSHGVSNPDTWTPPTGMTEAFDVLGGGEAVEGNYVLQAAAGPTGAKSATSATTDVGNAHILALRPINACAAVPEATYVAAAAPSGTGNVTVYWSSANPVIVLRKQGAALLAGEAPVNGTSYTAGTQPWGAGATMPYVAYDSSAGMAGMTCAGTTCTNTGLTNGTTYYYKVFPKNGTCYATGTGAEVNVTPQAGSQPAWSYTLAGGPMLKAGIAGEGTVHTASNASSIISLNTADGTQTWAPLATNQPIQSWLTWLPGAPVAAGWYNASWTARKRIRINKSKVGSGGVTDFPVLISLTDTALKTKAQASGNDILFTSSDGTTKLSHEIERYTSSTGELIAWVKVPTISSTADTDLYMYYGNAAAANQQNAGGVWSNGYVGVWHLKEDPAGAAPQVQDSTVNASHGTAQGGMTSSDQVVGKIGGALNFISTTAVNAGDKAIFELPVYSWSMWIKGNTAAVCLSVGSNNEQPLWNADTQFQFNWSHSSCNAVASANHRDSVNWNPTQIVSALSGGIWYYIVGTYDGSNLRVYRNGVLEATTPVGAPVATAGALGIGNDLSNGGFAGQVDEVQVSNVARLLAWIQTEYNNQNSPSTFYSVGAENASGVVIGGDQSGRVYSVDTATWTTTWTANLSASADFIQATPAAQLRAYANAAFQAAHPDDVIFVASRNAGDTNCGLNSSSTNNKVFALLASDGSVRWTFNGACTDGQVDWIVGMPYVDYARNRLYVTSRAGAAGTQTSLWVIDTLTGALVTPPSPLTLGHSEASPTLSWDGSTIYVGNLAGTLYAVDATTLAVKWSLSVGAAVKGFVWEDYSIPGRLYFSTGSDVRCVQDNGASGSACAGWTVSAIAGSSTLLLLDKIYVGSSDGKLHQIVPTGINAGVDEKQFPAATTLDGTTVGDVSTETGTEVFVGTAAGKLYKIPLPLP